MAESNIESQFNSAQTRTVRAEALGIADIYVNRYTCGKMADRWDDEIRETNEANAWVLAQCKANGVSMDELRAAIYEVAETKYAHTACLWDVGIFDQED